MSRDALVLIKQDHQQIRRLFRAWTQAHDDRERRRTVQQVTRLLMVHSFIEEELVYPRLRLLVPHLEAETLIASEEHHLADTVLGELSSLHPDSGAERLEAKTRVLIDLVSRHIEREERVLMPAVRKAVGRRALQELGADILVAREQAPEPGPGHRLEEAVSALIGR